MTTDTDRRKLTLRQLSKYDMTVEVMDYENLDPQNPFSARLIARVVEASQPLLDMGDVRVGEVITVTLEDFAADGSELIADLAYEDPETGMPKTPPGSVVTVDDCEFPENGLASASRCTVYGEDAAVLPKLR